MYTIKLQIAYIFVYNIHLLMQFISSNDLAGFVNRFPNATWSSKASEMMGHHGFHK